MMIWIMCSVFFAVVWAVCLARLGGGYGGRAYLDAHRDRIRELERLGVIGDDRRDGPA